MQSSIRPLRFLLGASLTGLASLAACSSTPPANPPQVEAPKDAGQAELVVAEADPAGGCLAYDFAACTDACGDHACLEWCAGTRCTELAASLYECIAPAEPAFLAKYPEPVVETLPPGPDADPEWAGGEMPDPDSEARWVEWETQKQDAHLAYWEQHCEAKCSGAVDAEDDSDDDRHACDTAARNAEYWGKFTPPKPPEPTKEGKTARIYAMKGIAANSGILGAMAGESALFGLMGSSMSLDREALGEFEHAAALARLVRSQYGIDGLSDCIPELKSGDEPRRFKLGLQFDESGHVTEAIAESDSREASCVAEQLAQNVRLPARALDQLPKILVDVSVSVPSTMFGSSSEDVWGGLVGAEVGDAYGVGGLGLVGSGEGGGGTGEGTIGLGNYGTIGRGAGSGGGRGSGSGGGGTGYGSGTDSTSGVRMQPTQSPPDSKPKK